MYGLYKRYWETLATWADDCEFKREDRVNFRPCYWFRLSEKLFYLNF